MVRRFELGFQCNNSCVFCAQGELRAQSPEVEAERVLQALDELRDGEEVVFAGGEPTLVPELPLFVERARSRGASFVLVQTNARKLAVPGYAKALREAGVSGLEVALYGATPEVHDYHTGVVGSFRQSIAGLNRARAERIAVNLSTVVTRSNFRHLSEFVRVAHALGANAVQFSPLRLFGGAVRASDSLLPPPELVAPHLKRALSLCRALGLDFAAGEVHSNEAVVKRFAGLGSTEPQQANRLVSGVQPGSRLHSGASPVSRENLLNPLP